MKNPNVLVGSDYGPIIVNVNDKYIGGHILKYGYWAKDDINLIFKLIDFLLKGKQEIIFYDVGSNIGTHSLALGKTYKEKIKIRAFEAQRQIYNMLCGTIALNGLDNIFCYNLAVSDGISDSIKIFLPDYSQLNNFGGLELIKPIRSDNHDMIKKSYEEVRTTTLDHFDEAVDFIEIDIEGMEDNALKGATIILQKYKPICFIELFKTDVEFVIDLFKSMNYYGFQKDNDLIAIPDFHNVKIDGLNRLF